MSKEAMKLALDALETEVSIDWTNNDEFNASAEKMHEAIAALKEALAEHAMREVQRLGQEIEQDHTYGYASRLAVAIWQEHYMKDAPKWKPLDTTEGVLTQIDNMTCGLVKEKPIQPEQEPVAWISPSGALYRTRYHAVANAEQSLTPLYLHPPQRIEQEPEVDLRTRWPMNGWILVPVTLTNDMTSAMADALEDPNNERSSWDLAENMWQAMLPKVPTPPAPQRTEQEPVAWFTQARNFVPLSEFTKEEAKLYGWNELYLRPPQRKPLTDQQYFEIGQRHWLSSYKVAQIHKEIDEAARGIKENT